MNTINEMRALMLDQLRALRDADDPESLERETKRGDAITQLSRAITETAKVEVDFLRVTHREESEFFDGTKSPAALPNGITGITRHRIAG